MATAAATQGSPRLTELSPLFQKSHSTITTSQTTETLGLGILRKDGLQNVLPEPLNFEMAILGAPEHQADTS